MTTRVEIIKQRINESLSPERLEIVDDSQAHAGHAGARESGGGHFSVLIVSQLFDGRNLVQRHQLVYQSLGELMQNEIHALRINALTPEESN